MIPIVKIEEKNHLIQRYRPAGGSFYIEQTLCAVIEQRCVPNIEFVVSMFEFMFCTESICGDCLSDHVARTRRAELEMVESVEREMRYRRK